MLLCIYIYKYLSKILLLHYLFPRIDLFWQMAQVPQMLVTPKMAVPLPLCPREDDNDKRKEDSMHGALRTTWRSESAHAQAVK